MKLHERLRLADIAAPEVPQAEVAKPAIPRESFDLLPTRSPGLRTGRRSPSSPGWDHASMTPRYPRSNCAGWCSRNWDG